MDNLNTHTYRAILETFEFQEAVRYDKKGRFLLYSKTMQVGLTIAEIEINAMDTMCTGRRIHDKKSLNG